MRKGIFAVLVLVAAGAGAFMLLYHPKRIDAVSYSPNDHRNWPIMQISARLNGIRVYFPNSLTGGGATSFWSDIKEMHFSAEWVEMVPNLGWRAEFSIPMETAPLYATGNNHFTLNLDIMFGRNGELQLVTWDDKVLIETCGTRAPELDKDYRDQIPLDQRFKLAYDLAVPPFPETSCPNPEK